MYPEVSEIKVERVAQSRVNEVDWDNLPFGREFSDHMFEWNVSNGVWDTPTIKQFGMLTVHPATSAMHYGQSIFEGMKAYRNDAGEVFLFRFMDNIRRMNASAERMCMEPIPEDVFRDAVLKLVDLDRNWIPTSEGSSLYIRPLYYASDEYVGIKPSDNYKFIIITSPVGAYYSEPLRVKIEEHYTRAANGGVGMAKTAGNYAASLYPAKLGQQQGFHQLVWTDSKEHKYIEESGTMNICFVIDGKLITPSEQTGTILPGITKRSVVELAQHWGMEVEERAVEVAEVIDAIQSGRLTECFGAGTAATIAHIAEIGFRDEVFKLPAIEGREFSNRVFKALDDMKHGRGEDPFGWVHRL